MSDSALNQSSAPTARGLVRRALEQVLGRISAASGQRALAAERAANPLITQHHAGQSAGLATAAAILQDELDRLPKES